MYIRSLPGTLVNKPTIEVPGPKSKACTKQLDAIFDGCAVQFVVDYTKSNGNLLLSSAMISSLVNRPAIGNFPSSDFSSLLRDGLMHATPQTSLRRGREVTRQKKPSAWKTSMLRLNSPPAASSAVNIKSGSLEGIVNSEYIYTQDGSDRQIYECTNVEDFDNHVETAQLNTRAWVMQERFLSCRTVHFSAGQNILGTWQRAQTARRSASNSIQNFQGYSTALDATVTINFLQSLIEDYSKRGLSNPTNRAVAFCVIWSSGSHGKSSLVRRKIRQLWFLPSQKSSLAAI
ncbi:hypothetical protein OIDMADRAFT_34815 [Oidiodendron maius Zn]|uniref:Uncharacterized protein n=1 Tax=Oidiodendron maius (strain Zn) TaxID=913774 RepID=A0A0C3GDK3_OIDMZ|nr:hypothetical protein OIDMADRAFT_34815 [Oidiodendron maius Zn]